MPGCFLIKTKARNDLGLAVLADCFDLCRFAALVDDGRLAKGECQRPRRQALAQDNLWLLRLPGEQGTALYLHFLGQRPADLLHQFAISGRAQGDAHGEAS